MKNFYLLLTISLILSACSGSAAPIEVGTVSPIQVRVVSWDHEAGEFRLAFALLDGTQTAVGISGVTLNIFPLDGDSETAVWSGEAVGYTDYTVPYWTAYPTINEAGFWGVVAEVIKDDGEVIPADFIIEVAAEVSSLPIGTKAPASQNRTLSSEPDINLLSSGNAPNPAFYQLTVADAIQSKKPTIVGFLTPGLCQTQWCAPVLSSVEAVRQNVGEDANFIHIEVFSDFQELTYVPEMAEWGLGTMEPWVFVLNGAGEITAKFSGPLSPDELEAAVRPLIK